MAFFKGSRYETIDSFDPAEDGTVLFRGIKPRPVKIPQAVLEHTVAAKERLDSLAQNYYASSALWTRIAQANPDVLFAEDLLVQSDETSEASNRLKQRLGSVVLIPQAREQ